MNRKQNLKKKGTRNLFRIVFVHNLFLLIITIKGLKILFVLKEINISNNKKKFVR